jgi:hypothetical protein
VKEYEATTSIQADLFSLYNTQLQQRRTIVHLVQDIGNFFCDWSWHQEYMPKLFSFEKAENPPPGRFTPPQAGKPSTKMAANARIVRYILFAFFVSAILPLFVFLPEMYAAQFHGLYANHDKRRRASQSFTLFLLPQHHSTFLPHTRSLIMGRAGQDTQSQPPAKLHRLRQKEARPPLQQWEQQPQHKRRPYHQLPLLASA